VSAHHCKKKKNHVALSNLSLTWYLPIANHNQVPPYICSC